MSMSSVRVSVSGGVDHVVAEERRAEQVDTEEHQLAGGRVDLGVGGHG